MKKDSLLFLIWILAAGLFILPAQDLRELEFSGTSWVVKEGRNLGPGPNRFDRRRITREGEDLVLTVEKRGRYWNCAELYTRDFYECGRFTLIFSVPAPLDSSLVFGFFLYNSGAPPDFAEADFEISRWGDPSYPNAQFALQPYDTPGNAFVFSLPEVMDRLVCEIIREKTRIRFRISDSGGKILAEWENSGPDVPGEIPARVHLNLWLFGGGEPDQDGGRKVLLHSFRAVRDGSCF